MKFWYRTAGLLLCAAVAGALPRVSAGAEGVAVQVAELTPDVEKAIQSGLDWLAKNQAADGSWGGEYKVASTSLGLMAFMVKGNFPERPPYADKLSRAVDYLLQQSQGNGYMGKSMYEHGLATLALSEVWGMSSRAEVGDSLKSAVGVILRAQAPNGGWRYNPTPTDADMSVTVMQLVALASAKEAGVLVPDATVQKAIEYVLSCRHKDSGGFGYQPGGEPGFERSGAGVMSLMMCGKRTDPAVESGIQYLLKLPGNIYNESGQYFYGHYYAVQAMYQAGDLRYQEWYPKIRDALLKKQAETGQWTDPHGIGTQMAILILGVPYRFLPIYQR